MRTRIRWIIETCVTINDIPFIARFAFIYPCTAHRITRPNTSIEFVLFQPTVFFLLLFRLYDLQICLSLSVKRHIFFYRDIFMMFIISWPHTLTECILSGKQKPPMININCFTNQSEKQTNKNIPSPTTQIEKKRKILILHQIGFTLRIFFIWFFYFILDFQRKNFKRQTILRRATNVSKRNRINLKIYCDPSKSCLCIEN